MKWERSNVIAFPESTTCPHCGQRIRSRQLPQHARWLCPVLESKRRHPSNGGPA